MSFSLMHNHNTRDVRPEDCPKCRFQQIKAQLEKAEKVIELMAGMAGSIDAKEGCVNICKKRNEYFKEKNK